MDGFEMRRALEEAARERYDNDDFVRCFLGMLKTEENMETALLFIEKANEVGDEVTHDDIVGLGYVLRSRLDSQGTPG